MATTIKIEGDQITLNDAASEETLRELVNLLQRQNGSNRSGSASAQGQQKQTADNMKKAADNLKNATVKLGDVVETFDDIEKSATKSFTDIGNKIGKELGTIAKNTGNVINDLVRGPASFETLGRAIQAGSQQAGELMEEFAQGAAGAIPGIGAFGTAMKGGAALIGAGAMAAAAYAQNLSDGFVALSQSGANFNADIAKTASQIQALGLNLNSFTQIVSQNASGLAAYGGTVSNGARMFTELADTVHKTFGGELAAIGLRYEEQNESLAKYIAMQNRNTQFSNLTYTEQSELYREYIRDLNRLATLTGKNRQQLADELAQNTLRADANLRLQGATEEARKALNFAFSMTGQDSAISQILMAGVAGKDLAFEVAAGNVTIRDFMAGAPDVAERLRQLGDDVATGKISQEEFLTELGKVSKDIVEIGGEFSHLHGQNGVATTLSEAGDSAQHLGNQLDQVDPGQIEAAAEKSAEGVGGAVTLMETSLTEVASTLKSEMTSALDGFVEKTGLEGMDIGKAIQNVITNLDLIAREFYLFASAPLDYILGGLEKDDLIERIYDKHGKGDLAGALGVSENDLDDTLNTLSKEQLREVLFTGSRLVPTKANAPGSTTSQSPAGSTGDLTTASTPGHNGSAADAAAAIIAKAEYDNDNYEGVSEDIQEIVTEAHKQLDSLANLITSGGTITTSNAFGSYGADAGMMAGMLFDTKNAQANQAAAAIVARAKGIYSEYLTAYANDPNANYQGNNRMLSLQSSVADFERFASDSGKISAGMLRQYGGAVGMGLPYMVGERGAELFTPLTAGTITPSNELATAQGNMSILAKLDQLNSTMSLVAGNTGNRAQTEALNNQISTLKELVNQAKRTYRVSRDLRNNSI